MAEGYLTLSSSQAYYEISSTCDEKSKQGTHSVLLLVEHEGSNGPASIGMITGLTMDTDGSLTNAELVLSTGDSARRRRHCW